MNNEQTCDKCRFGNDYGNGISFECRKKAPTLRIEDNPIQYDSKTVPQPRILSIFPIMKESDWCGEFESNHDIDAIKELLKNEQ